MIKKSLAVRVLFITLLTLALPLLIYFLLFFKKSFDEQFDSAFHRLRSLGRCRASLIAEISTDTTDLLKLVVQLSHLNDPNQKLPSETINQSFSQIVQDRNYGSLFYLALTEEGKFICKASSSKNMIGNDYSSYSFVKNAYLDHSIAFLSYGIVIDQKALFIMQSVPSQTDHHLLGIIVVAIPIKDILHKLVESEPSEYPVYISLVDQEQIVFAGTDESFDLHLLAPLSQEELMNLEKGKSFGPLKPDPEPMHLHYLEAEHGGVEWKWAGIERIGVQIPIVDTGLSLLLYADKDVVFRKEFKNLFHFTLIFCLLVILGGLLTLWMVENIAAPLKELEKVMRLVGQGDYRSRFKKSPFGFEINQLGAVFNQMIEDLLANMEIAREERVNRERLASELKIGREIQLSLLPQKMPQCPYVDIAAVAVPALEVGGDFYDLYLKPDLVDPKVQRLMLTVADTSGKGVSACLYSLGLRSMLRSYGVEYEDVALIVQLANNLFCLDSSESSMFVTAAVAMFDPTTQLLHYYCAGHPPIIVRQADGSFKKLGSQSPALGVVPFEGLVQQTFQLQKGDLILLYTDGVTDADDIYHHFYGETRFLEFIDKHVDLSAQEFIQELLVELKRYAKGAPQYDDITLVVLKVLGP